MSRHRIYQNYDYENDIDEYDGDEHGEEDEELSPEDRTQMEQGTAEVRTVLGPQADKVTTQQIQEALWHYYYDVDKSVAYLVSKFIDPAPGTPAKSKAQKNTPQSSNGTQFFDSLLPIDTLLPTGASEADPERAYATIKTSRPPSCASFFADMPWLKVPEDRRTTFIKPPQPRGWLLGGSSVPPKMSKLQALAAARKKKGEEKKVEKSQIETHQRVTPRGASDQEKATENSPRTIPRLSNKGLQRTVSTTANGNQSSTIPQPASDFRPSDISHAGLQSTCGGDATFDDIQEGLPQAKTPALKAQPSAFAQALFRSASETPTFPQPYYYTPHWMAFTTPTALEEAFSRPSPDDVVLKAQSQSAGKKSALSSAPNAKIKGAATEVANGLKNLKVEPLPKSKSLNVISEYEKSKGKKTASFVVVGHVDSGKSTMLGRLLLDLKVVDQRTVEKYRKEAEKMGKSSFALAWVLDSRTEERTRGVTIDIATNNFETEKTSFTMIDAPGHRDFIPNMLAGAAQADLAVLVVDAAKGAFEAGLKGQTKEHALLLRSMGVFRIVVAVNKLDTVQWDKERFDEIKAQVSGSFKALKWPTNKNYISFVPVSGLKGDNIIHRTEDPAASWYTGPTLIEELDDSEPMPRALDKPLRMMISDLWDTILSPITVSGRIDAGTLQVGDALLVQPSGEKAYVKSIELNNEPVDWAVAGHNIVAHLSHIEEEHIRIGDVICSPKDPLQCVDAFTMRALAFDTFFPMPVSIHRGRLDAPGKIRELRVVIDIHTGKILKTKPQVVKAGSVARIRVRTEDKVPLEKGDRVILRYNGNTVAAGLLE